MTELDDLAHRTGFSGVVRVDRKGGVELQEAYGFADRGHGIRNTVDTQFATASATKGLTALTVVRLIQDGALDLTTTARSVLGSDLPLIGEDVTVEHLLAHRSGIGDYLDESAGHEVTDYVMPVPVHELAETEQFLRVLDGYGTVFPPDEQFAYNNGAYVVLALIAERASGTGFHDLVLRSVCRAGGHAETPRSCAPTSCREAPRSATWPRTGLRTNVLHLPVRGNGDGGIYMTAADVSALWEAFFAGRIVSPEWVAEMVRPRSDVPSESRRYGLGFWLHESSDVVMLEGYDAGVSFWSAHDPGTGATRTVISNWTDGAWPIAELLQHAS